MSLLIASLFFLITISYCSTNAIQPKVVIIGAGPAGLAAATKLLENAIDVTVLEAETRIGGRIKTIKFADGNIDLGAHGCHGEKNNAVYEMVKDLDLLEGANLKNFTYVNSNGQKIDDNISNEAHKIFTEVMNNWDDTVVNVTTRDYFLEQYQEAVLKQFPADKSKQNEILPLIKIFKHMIMSQDGTNDWNDSSAGSDYKSCEGHEFLLWKNHGFKIFLDVLMKKYPKQVKNFDIDAKIQTGKVVEKIIWNNKKVVITCQGGDQLKADYVIFTPSLGVLKAKHMDLFYPNLPDEKVKAIKNKGFGSIGLISAHFPEAWWGEENFTHTNFLLWLNEDVQEDKEWLKDIFAIVPLKSNPNVLEMWVTGKNVPKFENVDELVLIEGIDYMMKKFFGNSNKIVKADKIARSDWVKNSNFRGCYSYETIEYRKPKNPSSVESLIEPLLNDGKPVVMFAGEATHPHYYSTVHGAVETGWREAKRIIDDINKNNKN